MAENSGISWTHATQNFWVGCDKVAPECAKCYIFREIRKQTEPTTGELRQPWGEVYRTDTWAEPWKWEEECIRTGTAKRVFTCSLSDFFHVKADHWRGEAWQVIKRTPHLVWLVLTKRPSLIAARLPADWKDGYPNVWLGVSVGTRMTLNKMDALRKIPAAVRWVSAEPLLEDISKNIDLTGFGWVVCGGESGKGTEYTWDPKADWKAENASGRRTLRYKWAANLRDKVKAARLPFMFKQVTAPGSGFGYNALEGVDWHEFPPPPSGLTWAARQPIPAKFAMTPKEWKAFVNIS